MAQISQYLKTDPTLEAMCAAIERVKNAEQPRPYMGMSAIGDECERRTWLRFRWAWKEFFKCHTLLAFQDGHDQEEVMAKRLRLVDGLVLHSVDPTTGKQFAMSDLRGHFRGNMDGAILGLLQAPKKWHVWEHKSSMKFSQLQKLIDTVGEKNALRQWNKTYYDQAQCYMHYWGTDRHYMTVSTPGGRDFLGLRTELDEAYALRIIARADRLINSATPPAGFPASHFMCKMCSMSDLCHGTAFAQRNCRTCLHSSPADNGAWHCARWGKHISTEEQRQGCPAHLYIPGLVPGKVLDATDDSVTYALRDGRQFINSEKGDKVHVQILNP